MDICKATTMIIIIIMEFHVFYLVQPKKNAHSAKRTVNKVDSLFDAIVLEVN